MGTTQAITRPSLGIYTHRDSVSAAPGQQKPSFRSIEPTPRRGGEDDDKSNMENFLQNKHYADLRIKIGAKKRESISQNHNKGNTNREINKRKNMPAFDQDTVPSDIDEDQWAEIHNYDYQ